MSEDPALSMFLMLLLALIVGCITWYITAEQHEDRYRQMKRQYQTSLDTLATELQKLKDEKKEAIDATKQLDFAVRLYQNALENQFNGGSHVHEK